jgi:DNA-directed RNA polymerase sigma subunit (sigma70/sigma32)
LGKIITFSSSLTHISLDAKKSSDSKYNLLDLQENTQLSPEDEYMRKAEIETLLNAINQLSSAEKDVLIRHYGLYNQPVQTFEEIAEVQKKSKARIHQIAKSKQKLVLKLA